MKLLQRSTRGDPGAGDDAGQWEGIMAVEEASWRGEGQRESAYVQGEGGSGTSREKGLEKEER